MQKHLQNQFKGNNKKNTNFNCAGTTVETFCGANFPAVCICAESKQRSPLRLLFKCWLSSQRKESLSWTPGLYQTYCIKSLDAAHRRMSHSWIQALRLCPLGQLIVLLFFQTCWELSFLSRITRSWDRKSRMYPLGSGIGFRVVILMTWNCLSKMESPIVRVTRKAYFPQLYRWTLVDMNKQYKIKIVRFRQILNYFGV